MLYGWEIFAHCDSTSKIRLAVTYNAIIKYVYGIRRYDGIPGIQYSKSLYGVELIDVLKIKASTLLHQVIYTQKPYYFLIAFNLRDRTEENKLLFINTIRLWNS